MKGLRGPEIYRLNASLKDLPNMSISLPLLESSIIKFLTDPCLTLPLKLSI